MAVSLKGAFCHFVKLCRIMRASVLTGSNVRIAKAYGWTCTFARVCVVAICVSLVSLLENQIVCVITTMAGEPDWRPW